MQSRRGKRATTWEVALLVASLGLARGSFLAQAPANRRGVVNVMILVADGCAVKVPTEEAQQARCVDILASNRYRLDAQTENRLERAKCQAFPAFSKRVSSRLSYKVNSRWKRLCLGTLTLCQHYDVWPMHSWIF